LLESEYIAQRRNETLQFATQFRGELQTGFEANLKYQAELEQAAPGWSQIDMVGGQIAETNAADASALSGEEYLASLIKTSRSSGVERTTLQKMESILKTDQNLDAIDTILAKPDPKIKDLNKAKALLIEVQDQHMKYVEYISPQWKVQKKVPEILAYLSSQWQTLISLLPLGLKS
jgi:hypothetical protein